MDESEMGAVSPPVSCSQANPPGGKLAERPLELLAPAGDAAALAAALEAGAAAVYFGLAVLNARRRARNFTQQELKTAVRDIHAAGARAYLTLNTDIAQRELELAARTLELARRTGVDAVLVRDPALLALRGEYPELEFHFSTQTAVTCSADAAAAAALGAARVVLAREMSLEEITAASAVPGIQTEVFCQGALCFSISGRCLMSSWVGGRSGNRGACTSPCRVPWTIDEQPAGTPLAMHDLATLRRLGQLARAGVRAVKIEGRMKNAAWVRQAVSLYRRAIDGEDPAELADESRRLGAYTGRQLTCGYLDGRRDDLTGVAGRESASADDAGLPGEESDPFVPASADSRPARMVFDLELNIADRGIECRCECGGYADAWSIPKTVVRRPHKAMAIGDVFGWLATQTIHGCTLGRSATNDPSFLLVPRAVNGLATRIAKLVQRYQKHRSRVAEVELPASVAAILAESPRHPANRNPLGSRPDRARLEAGAVETFLGHARPQAVIVEGLTAETLDAARDACGRTRLVAALPAVFFEDRIPAIAALVDRCARTGVAVEVNSWGGWHLAQQAGARLEGGPGLGVLNALAARTLGSLGFESVTLSVEADRRQLEELANHCPVACSLVVFGRPALMTSRVELPEEYLGRVFEDRRDQRVAPRREHGLWVFRPVDPFDLRDLRNDRLRVKHLVVDLIGSPDPAGEWASREVRRGSAFRFNYDRSLA